MTGASSVGFDRRPCSTIGSQPCNTLSSKLLPKKRSSKVAAPIKISHVVVNPGSLGLDTGWDLLQPTSRSKGPLIWLRTSPFSQQAPPSLTQAAAETGRNAHGDAESSASSRSRRSAPSCRRISPPPPRSPSPPMSAPHKDPARKHRTPEPRETAPSIVDLCGLVVFNHPPHPKPIPNREAFLHFPAWLPLWG